MTTQNSHADVSPSLKASFTSSKKAMLCQWMTLELWLLRGPWRHQGQGIRDCRVLMNCRALIFDYLWHSPVILNECPGREVLRELCGRRAEKISRDVQANRKTAQ